jgi:3-methyladenine DNA glycosylase/8-oxoguanine DNA glycosylase
MSFVDDADLQQSGPDVRIDHAAAARQFRAPGDPTTVVTPHDMWRATVTPDGPATVHVRWEPCLDAEAWGPGADWLLARVPGMIGMTDTPGSVSGVHPVVDRAAHCHPDLRIARSGTVYHDIQPTIVGQRITTREAGRQWRELCQELGGPAPGPGRGLLLPPAPEALTSRPTWWFHRFGLEVRRAATLIRVARHADRLLAMGDPADAAGVVDGPHVHRWLQLIDGVGPWTAGLTVGMALGHPDEIAVGDFHLKNTVVHALTGRERGTDDEMLHLLAPFVGQRNRVVHLLHADRWSAPARGPRRRTVPVRYL